MTFLTQIIDWFISLLSSWGGTPQTTIGSSGGAVDNQAPPSQSMPSPSIGNRHQVTEPERVTAHFWDTGSGAWQGQKFTIGGKEYRGIHGGTDFAAPSGSPVYAPYSMKIIAIAYYPDEGRRGWYVIGTLPDGAEYYSGHLNNILVQRGQLIESGTQIGQTWAWWSDAGRPHTHIQIKVRGEVVDPEQYFQSH